MKRMTVALIAAALTATAQLAWPQPAEKPAPKPPIIEAKKVEGTDNIYTFRYANSVAMFIVTPAGVIATDPIGYGRPQASETYLAEIRKVTDKPVKYVVYSHHHFDHIAGGKPFKDAGAKFVSHKKAKDRLAVLKDPHTVVPDETFTGKMKTIKLGGTTLELHYIGLNHSDSTLVMRVPSEKIIFLVDLIPVGSVPGRGLIDFYPLEAEESIRQVLKMDWDRMIPGHPGTPNGRLGTRQDAQDQLAFLQDLSNEVKVAAQQGKCWDPVEKEMKLPKYASWPGYEQNLQYGLRRYCALWGRGT